MFSYIDLEQRIAARHPLRAIRVLVEESLREMSQDFAALYARGGRPSIPPEQLLRGRLLQMLEEMGVRPQQFPRGGNRIALGADKSYQERKFIEGLRQRQVARHVAEYAASRKWPNFLIESERSGPGYAESQKKRKLVERVFGWGKQNSLMRKMKMRGRERVDWFFRFLVSVHNLVRMVKLIPAW